MPIAEKTIRSLKLVNKNLEVDLLLLRWPAEGDVWMLALPCRVSRGGLILAVPGNGIPDEDLSQGQEASPEDILGPSLHVTISLQAEESLGDAVEVLLLEFTMGIRQQLERKAPRTRRPYLRFAEAQQLPDMAELDDAVDEWVTSGSLRDADWQTALEEEENPAPQADLKAVVAVLAKLEKRVEELQKHPNLQTVKTPAPQRKAAAKTQAAPPQIDGPNDKDMAEILRAMREEVGSRPERIADEPASRITAQDCINLVDPDMAQSSSGPSVDDMMKISMLKLMKEMQAKGSRKNKKLPGLVGTNGSSSEEEGETWSSTSRGGKAIEAVEKLRYAMKQNPGAYLERMEARMQRAVGAEEMGPLIPEKFIRSVPVGRSRTAGYALSGFATIHKLMLEGKQRHARLSMVPLGQSGPRLHPKTIHLHAVDGRDMDWSHHQRAEGGRVVAKEKRKRRRKRRWQSQGREEARVKREDFMQEHSGESFSFSSDQGASVAAWLEYLIDSMTDSSLPFSRYVRSTFTPAATPPPRASDKELFPCPPPFPWSCDKGPLQGRSRRRAARFRFRRSIELWTNLMVCALSHQALGVQVAPERGRRECKLNQAQEEMVHFLLKLSRSMVRLGTSESGCGLRLPAVGTHLSELRSELDALDSLPYARHKRQFGESSQGAAFAATKALPVVADRLSLPDQVENFDPRPYLSEKFRTIFEDPDTLLKTPEDMPPPIHIKGTASRTELLKVFARWDQLGRLFVCKTDEVNFLDRCELFAVAKDVDRDRQILHRKRRNRREYHVVGESRNLPHAVLLTQLPLGRDLVCACSVDDIRDFYHAYVATEKRARSSPVGPSFRWGEVAHLKAAQAALAANRITTGDRLVCCFKGLGMGDHAAIDIAQESHVNLLRSWGTFLPEETLNYRHPLPKPESGYYEGIMIDDHLGVQLLPWKGDEVTTLAQEGRDQQVFEAATAAYNSVDLRTHEGKKVRRSLHTKVWGAEIEGKAGLIGPSRCKLLRLAQLSVSMAKSGPVDQKLVEAITGLWAFNLQFRRPLFAFMYDIYHQLSPGGPEDLFKLTQGARNELMVLASCAPLCVCDARALPDSFLYCVDASPSGAGVCRAEVGIEVSGELWRRGDKVGYRMPLLSRLQSSLKAVAGMRRRF